MADWARKGRDKEALIIFNKGVGGFTGVQQSIANGLPRHPLFLRNKAVPHMGEWRADLRSVEDPGSRFEFTCSRLTFT